MHPLRTTTLLLAGGLLAAGLAACGGKHQLGDHDFSGRTLAVTTFATPAPELRTGRYDMDADDPVGLIVAAGGRVVQEVEARRARARLDSAAYRLDLTHRLADRTLERSARYLGARTVEDRGAADYLMEVDVRGIGLDASSDRLHLFVAATAIILDTRTGHEIWAADVHSHDRLSPDLVHGGVLEDVVSAGALSLLSVEDFEAILGRLADYAADRIASELRGDLRRVRDRPR